MICSSILSIAELFGGNFATENFQSNSNPGTVKVIQPVRLEKSNGLQKAPRSFSNKPDIVTWMGKQ